MLSTRCSCWKITVLPFLMVSVLWVLIRSFEIIQVPWFSSNLSMKWWFWLEIVITWWLPDGHFLILTLSVFWLILASNTVFFLYLYICLCIPLFLVMHNNRDHSEDCIVSVVNVWISQNILCWAGTAVRSQGGVVLRLFIVSVVFFSYEWEYGATLQPPFVSWGSVTRLCPGWAGIYNHFASACHSAETAGV